jgi:uncharacterized membrane protein
MVVAAHEDTTKLANLNHIFHSLHHFTHLACKIVTFTGSFILIGGVSIAIINIISTLLNMIFDYRLPMICTISYGEKLKNRIATFGRVRQQLGEITALGLEVLVVADIMETLTQDADKFSWESLGKIILISCVRTLLAFMLGREIKEIEEKIEGHAHEIIGRKLHGLAKEPPETK